MSKNEDEGLTYAAAGVDIDAGARFVDRIKPLAAATRRPGADAALGGFGGLFDLKAAGFDDPVLVAATDGVGTKLELAGATGLHHPVGVDLVAMCVNDVLAQGAEPLFFLDYFATGALDQAVAAEVVAGVAEGCRQAGCALIGGETAEMPGLYARGSYDVAGFCVGALERGRALPRTEAMAAGDALIALASSGAHSNGFSLIRRIVARAGAALDAPAPFDSKRTLGEALMAPTRIYVQALAPLIAENLVKGIAHITGGGLTENVPRMTPPALTPRIDYNSWARPALFDWLAEAGGVAQTEMRKTFNCGVGLVLAVAADDVETVLAKLDAAGEQAWVCGALVEAAA